MMENFKFEELDVLDCRIVRPTIEDLDMYFAKDLVSQSLLKYFLTPEGTLKFIKQTLEGTPKEVVEENGELYYHEKEAFVIGSAADFALTMGLENFYKRYSIVDIEEPTEVIKSIIHHVFDRVCNEEFCGMFANYTPYIAEAITEHNYYSNRKMETNVANIIDKGSVYFQQLVENRGKIILTTEIAQKVIKVANNYATMLVNYIHQNNLNSGSTTIYFQKEFNTNSEKGLIDIFIKDEYSGTIHLIDLKSTYSHLEFFSDYFKKYRVDIQLAFYANLIGFTPYKIYIFACNTSIFQYQPFEVEVGKIMNTDGNIATDWDILTIGKYGFPSFTVVGNHGEAFIEFHTKTMLGYQALFKKYQEIKNILALDFSYEEIVEKYFKTNLRINATNYLKL
jgi:hypothetical protein